jgi:hypothetical protein
MASSKITTIATVNIKTGKLNQYEATTWSVPGTPFIVNIEPGYEMVGEGEKRRYTITHKHTGWAIMLCGQVTLKSTIEAAKVLFDNYPAPLKVAMENQGLTPHELQDQIKVILSKRVNKTTWKNAKFAAASYLKQS